jgi:hypothetical protein
VRFEETAEIIYDEGLATCSGCKRISAAPAPAEWFRITRPLPGVRAMLACSVGCLGSIGEQGAAYVADPSARLLILVAAMVGQKFHQLYNEDPALHAAINMMAKLIDDSLEELAKNPREGLEALRIEFESG